MTRDELAHLLENLGLRGNHIVVHASLSSFGDVEGGASTVCGVLLEVVGASGTVLMPAFTYAETLGGPAAGSLVASAGGATSGPVPFHSDVSVSREIGVIAETFRHWPGVLRSSHPTHSFCAWGRRAREVLSTQRDNNTLGPLKKLNVLQGHVLLLGTTLQSVTAIHLAEEQAAAAYLGRRVAVRVNAAGYAERVVLENVPGCSVAFIKLEERLDPAKVRSVALPRGTARKIPVRHLVQLATTLLASDPQAFACERPGCASCAAKREAAGARTPSAWG
ncbi:MAG: AAC(3) family N-acetyltransferase [Candidatus Binatia bacterium]